MTLRQEPVLANFKVPREKRTRPKPPAKKRPGNDPAYLKKIRRLKCCVCGVPGPSEVHHLKCTGKRGGALRSPDCDTVPLCHEHHINGVERVSSRLELKWFQSYNISPLTLAAALWGSRHDLDAMMAVLSAHVGKQT